MRKLKKDENGVGLLLKGYSSDENYNPCECCLYEFDPKEYETWAEIKKNVLDVDKRIIYLRVQSGAYFLDAETHAVEIEGEDGKVMTVSGEIEPFIGDEEPLCVSGDFDNFWDEALRTYGDYAELCEAGVRFTTSCKYTNIVISSGIMQWDFLENKFRQLGGGHDN